jgi:putative sigma-54 modulation protein
MRVHLSGHHVEITPALRSYVERKLERLTRRVDRDPVDVHCVLTVEKLRHKAEATFMVEGQAVHADAIREDMYAAIDALSDKFVRRVRKLKERVRDHHAPEAQKHGLALAN